MAIVKHYKLRPPEAAQVAMDLNSRPIMHQSRPVKFYHNFAGLESPKCDLNF